MHTLAFPPPSLSSSEAKAVIKPYDGPDAQEVIQNVNARTHGHSASRAHNNRAGSVSTFNPSASSGAIGGVRRGSMNNGTAIHVAPVPHPAGGAREPSPTLPDIPSHPTLNSLINSSLTDAVANPQVPTTDPTILATSLAEGGAPPKIGDPGKRIIGAALGVRHPALGARVIGNGVDTVNDVQKAMGGLVVAE